MIYTQKTSLQRGFVSIITSIATGILAFTTLAVTAPTMAEVPEAETTYIALAHHYDVAVPIRGLSEDDKDLLIKARKVEQFYRSQKTDMPLADYAYEMVLAADKHGLDYALMPAIARFETSGGRNLCQTAEGANNPFGWGSCRMAFDSFEHAFDHVAWSLSGHNPKTTVYADKTINEILHVYNPPWVEGILNDYHNHILGAIDDIKSQDVAI
jgi:hypothetical protein